jgi:hypothetical protein
MPNTPFSCNHLRAIGARYRLALLRRHLVHALILGATCAQCADLMRHLPDAVLVGDQHVVIAPGEAIRFVEVLDVPLDPRRMAAAIDATQQRQITCALLGHQYVPIG